MAVPGRSSPAERWTVTAAWSGDAGQVLAQAGRKELADGEPSDDDQRQRGGRSGGVPDEAAETDTDDGDEAHGHGAEEHGPKHAGMAEGHLRRACRRRSAGRARSRRRCTSSATGKTKAATVAALAASTSRLAGMAVKVDRIIPVEYSAVTVRTASAPRTTAAIMTPISEALVGSNAWRCWAVMVCHWLISERATATPKPMAKTTVRAAVRQVEGRVRSFVHSALRMGLRMRLVEVARTGRAGVSGRSWRSCQIPCLAPVSWPAW